MLPDRYWSKVNKNGPVSEYRPDLGPCWLWTAVKTGGGYGQIKIAGAMVGAHGLAYEDAHGPIPKGLVIDHLCRVRHCVNPRHLEAVTNAVNLARGINVGMGQAAKTHCKNGHPFTPENTWATKRQRVCKACAMQRQRDYRRHVRSSGPGHTAMT